MANMAFTNFQIFLFLGKNYPILGKNWKAYLIKILSFNFAIF